MVEEYVDQSNVLIIHQENKGFSGARNTGLDLSNSAYIMFVDSGDFLPDGAIQVLMSVAKLNDAEVVRGRVFLC
ncbi:glycosyltransferase [Blautia producta]|uniref:glycosyltransferase n=1 Tax=Blautia producta TaxID=33035 RepID=UPI0009E015FE